MRKFKPRNKSNGRRRNGNGNRGGKQRNGNHKSKIRCWYCELPIAGKIWNWGGHSVHKKCHDKCCAKLRKIPRLINPPQRKGFLARLFNL